MQAPSVWMSTWFRGAADVKADFRSGRRNGGGFERCRWRRHRRPRCYLAPCPAIEQSSARHALAGHDQVEAPEKRHPSGTQRFQPRPTLYPAFRAPCRRPACTALQLDFKSQQMQPVAQTMRRDRLHRPCQGLTAGIRTLASTHLASPEAPGVEPHDQNLPFRNEDTFDFTQTGMGIGRALQGVGQHHQIQRLGRPGPGPAVKDQRRLRRRTLKLQPGMPAVRHAVVLQRIHSGPARLQRMVAKHIGQTGLCLRPLPGQHTLHRWLAQALQPCRASAGAFYNLTRHGPDSVARLCR